MRKKPTASKKTLRPDGRYHNILISKFINCMMFSGKKSVSSRIMYHAMDEIKKRAGNKENVDELEIMLQAIDNCKPAVEIKSKRVGGATYQVPMRVSSDRAMALSIRWILQAARAKKGRPMHFKLADEIMAAYRREGDAMTKRENVHKMAEANKAFAHFAHH